MARPRLRNAPLRQTVCELKFPPKPNLAEATVERLGEALEAQYPDYSLDQGVNIQIGVGGVGQQLILRHRFDSSDGWAVAVTNESVTLETTAYGDIDDFIARWSAVQDAVGDVLRLRRVTRLGLRYVNQLALDDGPIESVLREAIDERLLAPWEVLADEGSAPSASLQELRTVRAGAYLTMRHGLVQPRVYLLDFDRYAEDAQAPELADVSDQLRAFNEAIASAFERTVTSAQWQAFQPEPTS